MKLGLIAAMILGFAIMGCSSKDSSKESAEGSVAETKSETKSAPKISMEVINGESFVDARDNQVYRYVKIGNATWMKDNLRLATANSFCTQEYGGCDKVGRHYTIEELPTLCPDGWRMPKSKDFMAMQKSCKKNPGFCLWHEFEKQGSDEIGFSALAMGRYDLHVSKYSEVGTQAYFWSESNGKAKDVFTLKKGEYASSINRAEKSDAFTVRCVKME